MSNKGNFIMRVYHTDDFLQFCDQFSSKRILIYGASTFSKTLNDLLDKNIVAFIDNDVNKQKNNYLNKPIIDIKNIKNIKYDAIIIAVVWKEEEIKQSLIHDYDIDKNIIFYFKQTPNIFFQHKSQLYKYEYQLVKNFLTKENFNDSEYLLAPGFFLYDYKNCYPLEHAERLIEDFYINIKTIKYVMIPNHHQIENLLLQLLEQCYTIVYCNASYTIYKLTNKNIDQITWISNGQKKAAFITTYNRPKSLKKTLNLLEAFYFDELLIIDDCSDETYAQQYNEIFKKFSNKITVIKNPKNRGLAYSLNVGFTYLLADPSIKWVSYFQDDITYIDKNLYSTYAKYENSEKHPIMTGYYGKEHPILRTSKDDDIDLYFLQSTPGVHIHMHRKYINNFLPIPTHFLGAPKNKKHSHTDWWMSNWSLNSPLRNGIEILCIPNLVKTDLSEKNSTYRNIKENHA